MRQREEDGRNQRFNQFGLGLLPNSSDSPVFANRFRQQAYNNKDLENDVKLFASQQKDIQEEDVEKFTDFFLKASEKIMQFGPEFDDIGQYGRMAPNQDYIDIRSGSLAESPSFKNADYSINNRDQNFIYGDGEQQDAQIPSMINTD